MRAVLRENLAELLGVVDALAPAHLDARSAPAEWSVREILLHLIHAERWLHPQLQELRDAVAPDLAAPVFDPVSLPDAADSPDLNELRWALGAVREDSERLLQGLAAAQLREPANLGEAEEAVDISIRTMLLTAADHQLFHTRQIQRTLEEALRQGSGQARCHN